jgi:hypothetical protein
MTMNDTEYAERHPYKHDMVHASMDLDTTQRFSGVSKASVVLQIREEV